MDLQFFRDQYTRALRAIGQDLADLFPAHVEIEMSGDNFIARVHRRVGVSAWRNNEDRVVQQTLNQPSLIESSHTSFARTYTPGDIDQLDEMGRARRTANADQGPDLYSLSERLRMIGRIMDERNAQLVNLSQDVNSITVKYRDAPDEIHLEKYSTLTLFKLQQHYYSARCFKPKRPSREAHQSDL